MLTNSELASCYNTWLVSEERHKYLQQLGLAEQLLAALSRLT